jgi:alkyl hydroperoxide reductase subunit D
MSIEALKDRLPAYAKDIKLNLSNIVNSTALTKQQLWGTILVSAIAARNETVIEAAAGAARQNLPPEAIEAAKAAAAIMAMNTIYYRSTHLIADPELSKMPARLRMNVIANPGVDKNDFELWCTAVSAINGCGACLDSHEKVLREHGVANTVVQAAIRIGAVVNAVSRVVEAEAAAA